MWATRIRTRRMTTRVVSSPFFQSYHKHDFPKQIPSLREDLQYACHESPRQLRIRVLVQNLFLVCTKYRRPRFEEANLLLQSERSTNLCFLASTQTEILPALQEEPEDVKIVSPLASQYSFFPLRTYLITKVAPNHEIISPVYSQQHKESND